MVDFSEVVQAVNGLCTSLEGLVSALDRERVAADSDGGSTEPPRECWFEHTDDSDGTVFVRPCLTGGWLTVETFVDSQVNLDPDAVNRLAQYLDGYRTDRPDEPVKVWGNCFGCGHAPHASRCREIREPECMGDECNCLTLTAEADGGISVRDMGVVCAGHFPDRAPDKTGCAHRKDSHGALGCVVHSCPCERRGGR